MDYDSKFKNVSVLGAAGKMGSGILSLISIEAARLALLNNYSDFCINAIDSSPISLLNIKRHIKSLLIKHAEKNIVWLRGIYKNRKDLIENKDIIDEYATFAFDHINFSYLPDVCAESELIFEAIIEDKQIKNEIINCIEKLSKVEPWYLTNTSSIPINELDSASKLEGRIIGFHFYNPPPVQRLVELISSENTKKELFEFSKELAAKLNKIIVPANDVAGFIGNGFFMRDIITAVDEVGKLKFERTESEALHIINTITKDYLLRPMGIFQLVDYVGIDICNLIMTVMNSYFEDEEFRTLFLEKYLNNGIRGGQKSDATQRDGIFKYDDSDITGIYNFERNDYVPINIVNEQSENYLSDNPQEVISWKMLRKDRDKENTLKNYFNSLFKSESIAAELSRKYLKKCNTIGEFLVENSTAKTIDDVNTVIKLGFFHHYGPVNSYVNKEVEK